MRVALVHDDLVQWGGAERVLFDLTEIFPEAPIYTTVCDYGNQSLSQLFANKKIITSFVQKIPGWRRLYKLLLPIYPLAFEQFDFSGFDLVISQTTRFAKSIITKPQTIHICYCHTPPRFLWNFSGYKTPPLLGSLFSYLRLYDKISAKRVDLWLAGSKNAHERIKHTYHVDSKVLYPGLDLGRFSQVVPFDGGYLLTIARLNQYKRVDLVIEVARRLEIPLKVVGNGPKVSELKRLAGDQVSFYEEVSDERLTWLIAGCKALVVAAEEDFGLTVLEAQALAKPVIAYKGGGALESVTQGATGYFFDEQTPESLVLALSTLDKKGYNKKACLQNVRRFSKEKFIGEFKDAVSSTSISSI